MNKQNTEVWKKVTSGKNYSLSSLGRIRDDTTGEIKREPAVNNVGYQNVGAHISGIGKPTGLHRVVARMFVPNPFDKPDVNHKNGIRHDNRAENLEWVTHRENIMHAVKAGRWRGGAKKHLEIEQVKAIREEWAEGETTLTALGLKYGITPSTARLIVYRKSWKNAA